MHDADASLMTTSGESAGAPVDLTKTWNTEMTELALKHAALLPGSYEWRLKGMQPQHGTPIPDQTVRFAVQPPA